jgi:hypothetical protein
VVVVSFTQSLRRPASSAFNWPTRVFISLRRFDPRRARASLRWSRRSPALGLLGQQTLRADHRRWTAPPRPRHQDQHRRPRPCLVGAQDPRHGLFAPVEHFRVEHTTAIALAHLVNSPNGAPSRRLWQDFVGRVDRAAMGARLWSLSYFAASRGGPPLCIVRTTSPTRNDPTSTGFLPTLKDRVPP